MIQRNGRDTRFPPASWMIVALPAGLAAYVGFALLVRHMLGLS